VELARARRHRRTFSLLFIDIDNFKQYNDSHGHLAGDDLLRNLAKLLQGRCRSTTVAARYGGEAFVLLVPETDSTGAQRFAEALRRLVAEHPFPGRESQPGGRVTLSLGVASYPEAGEDATALIDSADKALYQSKHRGRNTVSVWEPSLA
jgi:diguanylate cyclase (GGDEF)-like protein